MSDLVTLEAIAAEAHKADQMGRQTVEQLAKVGQMIVEYRAVNPTMADLSRVINATGYQQAHIYRLEKLAKHWPQLEQKHPESLRGALLLIEQSKPKAEPPKATPEPPEAPQQQDGDKWEAARDAESKAQNMFNNYVRANLAHFEQLLKFGEGLHELFYEEDFDDMSKFLEHAAKKTGADESDIEFAMTLSEKFESLKGRLTLAPVPAPKEQDDDAQYILDKLASAERLELEALNEYAKSI